MNRSLVLALAILALALLACVLPGQPTPIIQCTAPACADGDLYCPGGDCPGGCGTRCATWTPDPSQPSPTPTQPPEAPTASVNGTPSPHQRVDPHVATCLSAPEVAVGERLVLVGQAVDIGFSIWTLSARENGQSDFETVVATTFDKQVSVEGTAHSLLSFVEAQIFQSQIVLHFSAVAPGEVEYVLSASGEIHYGYPGPATWGGGASDAVRVVVR